MAQILGIKKGWFHGGKLPHYDVPKSVQKEIEAMCEQVSSKEIVRIIKGN